LRIAVPDGEAHVVEADSAELAKALAQLGLARGKRGRANQLGGADRLLLGTQEHQVPAMVAQVSRVLGLVAEVDLPVLLEQRGEARRQRPSEIAELLALDEIVERDRRGRPGVRLG